MSKPIVRSIPYTKYLRIQKVGKKVTASIFNKEDWTTRPAYEAVVYNGFIYCRERTVNSNFSTTIKKYPLEIAREEYNIITMPCKH